MEFGLFGKKKRQTIVLDRTFAALRVLNTQSTTHLVEKRRKTAVFVTFVR
jgi:hypothetical protein